MGGDFSRIKQSEYKPITEPRIGKDGKPKPIPIPKVREEEPRHRDYHIEVFTDASYRSSGGKAHAGYLVLLNRMLVASKATVQKRKAGSSTRAELLAVMDAMDGCLAIKLLLLEMGVSPNDISVVVWCDNDNTVGNINSVNPHATEFHSTVLLRQLHRIVKEGAQIDTIRVLFPNLMQLMESSLHADEFLIMDVGDGALSRYRNSVEMSQALKIYIKGKDQHPIISKKYLALYQIIFDRMSDSQIVVLHIDGVNQLADALTKMAVSIEYVGRVVHDYKDFMIGKKTMIRDEGVVHVKYRKEGHRERYDVKEERSDKHEVPKELENLALLPENLSAEEFLELTEAE